MESALKNIDLVIATSARFRNKNVKHIQLEDLRKIDYKKKVAFLFGSEASGLSNNEISYANYTLQIPTHPDFKSLNLSHSLIIVCYEIFRNTKRSYFNKNKKLDDVINKKEINNFCTENTFCGSNVLSAERRLTKRTNEIKQKKLKKCF